MVIVKKKFMEIILCNLMAYAFNPFMTEAVMI